MNRALPALLASTLALGATLAACAPLDTTDEPTEATAEELTESQYGRAVTYLKSLTYLPWSYTKDGCYARALYYTANLAAEGIPANHLYVVAQPGYGLGSTGEWAYHVAPLVSRDKTGQLLVLDPVYASTPLPLAAWYDRQSKYEHTSHAPTLRVAPGTSYGDRSGRLIPDPDHADVASFREPESVASMPAFTLSNISSACATMHRYIDAEGAATKDKKHHDLARDTKRLVTALASTGKLSGRAADLPDACTKYAPELAACPPDGKDTAPGSQACCLASAFWCYAGGACQAPGTKLGSGVCGEGGNFIQR